MTDKVLLVEDDADTVSLIQFIFKEDGLEANLVVARDGEDALAHLLAPENPLPKVVLLDVKMPRLDGPATLRRLRAAERTRLVPVVMLSSSERDDDVRESVQAGANSYIYKPVEFAAFSEAVRATVRYWLRLNRV